MLTQELSITKEFWLPVLKHVINRFSEGRYTNVCQDVYEIEWRKHRIFVAATGDDDLTIHGWLALKKLPRRVSFEVAQSYVFVASRGQGYGKMLYDTVLKEGIILSSGYTQSKSSRGMWKKFIKEDTYTIWAHDIANPSRYEPVIYDEDADTIWSALPIYQNAKQYNPSKQDIRLIAIRK